MIKVIISGVNGRMGKAVEALCRADETVEVVGGIDINLGVPHEFPTADNAFALETRADVIIDFSHHTCAAALCDYAAKTGTPVVFATTGYTPEEHEIIQKASEKAALFTSANMSVGVNLLIELSKKAAAVLQNFDVEIVESTTTRSLTRPAARHSCLPTESNRFGRTWNMSMTAPGGAPQEAQTNLAYPASAAARSSESMT